MLSSQKARRLCHRRHPARGTLDDYRTTSGRNGVFWKYDVAGVFLESGKQGAEEGVRIVSSAEKSRGTRNMHGFRAHTDTGASRLA
jgi:hypothetical protein